MDLIPDLRQFVQLLDAHEVRYLVVGGVAVNVLGFVRMTEDFDFWLERSEENAQRALAALHEFGMDEFTKEDLLDPNAVLQLGRVPNRIDLLTFITGREFEDCYPRRTYEVLSGLTVPMIALNDLLINKKATGRSKDVADVEEFERAMQRGWKPGTHKEIPNAED